MERQWKRLVCTMMSVLLAVTCIQSVKAEEMTEEPVPVEETTEESFIIEEPEEVVEEETEEIIEEETDEPVYEEESSDYTYTVSGDNVFITRYTGTEESVVIPETIEEKPVTRISKAAFADCTVKEVVFPSGVYNVEAEAFRRCYSLEKVVFNEGLHDIASYAFSECTALKTVEFSSTITYIGNNAFSSCPIENLELPANIVQIDREAFSGNTSLTTLTIPKTLTEKAGASTSYKSPFYNCTNLKEVIFEEGSTVAAANLFNGCYFLNTVVLPDSISTINAGAFAGCSGLTEILLPSSLQTIGSEAFAHCTFLESIVFPEGLQRIENSAFFNCTSLKNVDFSDTVTFIGNNAFSSCPIEDLKLPANLRQINVETFSSNPNLTTITIPKSLTEKAGASTSYKSPFYNCTNLKEVIFEDGSTVAAANLFNGCYFLDTIVLPDTLGTINAGAFAGCSGLTEILLPSSLQTIGYEAFAHCTSLESIVFPEGLQRIEGIAFLNCTSLKNVDFSDTVTYIGPQAFSSCPIEDLELPANLRQIERETFANNPNLKTLTIPKSLTEKAASSTTYNSPFFNCTNLREVVFEEGSTVAAANLFNKCYSLKNVYMPESVRTISNGAFFGCTGLENVMFPSSLQTIGSEAFAHCTYLESVVFPEGLREIQSMAFLDCPKMKLISLPNSIYSIASNSLPGQAVIHTNYDALGITYAINNHFAYACRNTEETPAAMIDRAASLYYTDSSSGMINDCVNVVLTVKTKDNIGSLTSPNIAFYVPDNITLLYNSVTFNGQPVTANLNTSTCAAVVNLPSPSGTLRFTLKLNGAEKFVSYATYNGRVSNSNRTDVIGLIDGKLSGISMEIPSDTSEKQFEVKGRAPSGAQVELYVEGELQNTVTALKNGSWHASVDLKDPVTDYPYTVQAKVKGSDAETDQVAQLVYYSSAVPKVAAFTAGYKEHGEMKQVDLLTTKSAKIYKDENPYHFEVTLENNAKVDKVYINSTKGSEVRRMEAVYDPASEKYIAEGYFGDNKNYVAGNLQVTYVSKPMTEEEKTQREAKLGKEMEKFWNTSIFELAGGDINWEVNQGDKAIGTVDMGKAINDFQNSTARVIYEHFHSDEGVNLFDYIDIGQHASEFMNTFVFKGDDYFFNLSPDSPSSYVVTIGKFIDPVNNIIKDLDTLGISFQGTTLTLDEAGKKLLNITYDNDAFKSISKQQSYIFKLAKVYQKDEELRRQLMWGPETFPGERQQKLRKLDALTSDKIAFLTLSTIGKEVLKTSIAAGGGGPAVMMTIFVAALVAASIFAFEAREDELSLADGDLKVIMDPSGYVYDSRTEKRLENVKASAYCIEYDPKNEAGMTEAEFLSEENKPADDEYGTLWNAEEYEQLNPQQTDAEGRYHWDVPTGWWRVKYEKEDYETTWSEWLPVPPPQMEVNIPLKSTKAPEPGMERLAGDSRYDTSIRIADELKEQMGVEKFDNIIVASGAGYADALAGGYLAYKKNAPILITSDKRADMIREYIRNNIADNGTVYVLGGPSAVSFSFEEGLEGIHTERLAGAGRYDTNIEILKAAEVSDEEIVIARGTGKSAYADSLSASGSKRPILLVNGDKGLNDRQKEYLEGLQTKQYYIAGGTGAVSETVMKQIEGYGDVERLAGGGRYETSVEIAKKFNPDAESVVLAYGANYPDGLCGGPLAAYMNAPLILTKSDKNLEYAQNFCKDLDIHTGYVLGGEGTKEKPLITDDAVKQILQLN